MNECSTLEITTTIGCSLMCTVCPQDKLLNVYKNEPKYLTYSNFVEILDKIPKSVRIDFSGMSEAWLNKECTKMLIYTLKSGFDVAIYSTLYGMEVQDVDSIFELIHIYTSQIKVFCVHLPDASNNMRGWKNSENYKYALTRFLSLSDDIKKSIRFETMTMDMNDKIHSDLSEFKIELTNKNWIGHTRGENLTINSKNLSQLGIRPKISSSVECQPSCVTKDGKPTYSLYDHNILIPNGNVLLCCVDYNSDFILGNLLKQSYSEIRNSNIINKLKKLNSSNEYIQSHICKNCVNALSNNP